MFFKSKKIVEENIVEYEEQPLKYWEEESFMMIPYKGNELTKDIIIERLSKIDTFKLLGFAEPSENKPGRIVFKYKDAEYEIFYVLNKFEYPEAYFYHNSNFTEYEINSVKECTQNISLCMQFSSEFKREYQVELKIATSIIEELYVILDESAEKALHPKYAYMLANSKILPGAEDLYSIQAIVDDNKVWLHTHGLCRLGITDLEILDSNVKSYNSHYNVIATLADILINKGQTEDNKYLIGCVTEDIPLFVTYLPWTKGLNYYEEIDLGGIDDREYEHNSRYSIIFVYENKESLNNNKLSKINVYDDKWAKEPIFLYTTEETIRMSKLAQERFYYVKKYFDAKKNNVLIKIGIKTDNDNNEHMWFELLNINENNTFDAKLVSVPYNVLNMKEGDIGTYTIEEVTHWILYIDTKRYTPDKVYLLEYE